MKIIPTPEKAVYSSKLVSEKERQYLIDTSLLKEEYAVKIDDEGKVLISYSDEAGRFYAEQTLKQLKNEKNLYPVCKIEDSPRFSYRGFMLDCARHIIPIDEIKKIIDAMALLKFSRFHWHLTDDQGWRFESEKFPVLNTVSAVREYSDFGKTYDGSPYGRVYTKAEMTEIVEYCKERFIEVIPEFDIPGHTSALLAAFPELSCNGLKVKVKTHQGIFKDVICPAKEDSLKTVCEIFDEICEVFPSEYVHIGGDEAPSRHWENCPDCQQLMKKLGSENYKEYQNYFMNGVIEQLGKKGKTCIVWNDAAAGKNLSKDAIVQYWKENDKATFEFANGGGRLILSPFTYYYTDYGYDLTPLNRTYSFNTKIKGVNPNSIFGLEVPIWTEYIDNNGTLEELLFPRAIAVAETAWSKNKKSYAEFCDKVNSFTPLLEELGIETAPQSEWTKSRAQMPIGWLRFVNKNYSLDYIKSALK